MVNRFATTDAHTQAFSEQQRERFQEEMLVHLRKEYAPELGGRDDAWVGELIRTGIEQARAYQIILERDVARYLELMLVFSPGFDDSKKTPWAKDILIDSRLAAEDKLDRIYEHIMFDEEIGETASEATVPEGARQPRTDGPRAVPRPLNSAAAAAADRKLQDAMPELEGRRLTMADEDAGSRERWMTEYRGALDDAGAPSPTSRPDEEVGAPVVGHPEPSTGTLVAVVVDAASEEPIAGASVQVSGPVVERMVSDYAGEARFEKIATGEYEVLALDVQQRMGQGHAVVKRGATCVSVSCRYVGG